MLADLEWLGSDTTLAPVLKGEALLGLDRLDEADEAFQLAATVPETAGRALLGAARVDLVQDRLTAAMQHVDAALALSESDHQVWFLKAEIAYAALEFDVARMAAERVLAIEKDNVPATLRLVESLLQLERAEDAEPHLHRLEQAFPKLPVVHFLLGTADKQLGDTDAAKRAFEAALTLSPSHWDSLFELAVLHYREQAYAPAREMIDRALEIRPDHLPSAELLAGIHLAESRHEDAVGTLRSAIRQAPTNRRLVSMLANTYIAMGKFDEGAAMLAQAAALSRGGSDARASTGTLTSHVDVTAVITPPAGAGDSQELIRLGLLDGALLLQRQDYAAALETAATVADKFPDNPLPSYLMGAAYEGLSDDDRAAVQYERALESDPRFAAALIRLAALEMRAGSPEQARTRFEAALERDPTHPELLTGLARLEREAGRRGGVGPADGARARAKSQRSALAARAGPALPGCAAARGADRRRGGARARSRLTVRRAAGGTGRVGRGQGRGRGASPAYADGASPRLN